MSRRRDVATFLALALVWGLSFPAIAVGLESLPPLVFAALRYDVAAVVLLVTAVTLVDGWWPADRDDLAAIAGGGLFLVAGNGLLFVGQQTVPSGVASMLQALVPIATALWAYLLLGERLSRRGVLGVLVGFAGIGLVLQPDPSALLAGDTRGRLLIVAQAASVSLGGVLVQRADPRMPRVPLIGWAMAVGAVLLHAASYGAGERPTLALEPTALGAVLYLGVVATAVAFVLFFSILADHGAFEAGLVTYLVPIVATLVGVAVLGESISGAAVAGFGLVAVGFALLKRDAVAALLGGVRP